MNVPYKKIGFVSSRLGYEIIAIVTDHHEVTGVGRLVYLNEDEAELGGIYILDTFRGKSFATRLFEHIQRGYMQVSFLLLIVW